MFVRWQTYRTKARSLGLRQYRERNKLARLRAVLVESVRIDGKPRQKHIAFLASIASTEIGDAQFRLHFWRRVTKRLNRLGKRISPEVRDRITASIDERVAGRTLTAAELRQIDRNTDDALRRLGAG